MKGKTRSITVATAITVALVGAGAALVVAARDGEDARQALVAERGRKVMPFDLERTTHRFAASPTVAFRPWSPMTRIRGRSP